MTTITSDYTDTLGGLNALGSRYTDHTINIAIARPSVGTSRPSVRRRGRSTCLVAIGLARRTRSLRTIGLLACAAQPHRNVREL